MLYVQPRYEKFQENSKFQWMKNKTDSIKQKKWNDFSKIIIIIHFYSDKLTCIIIYVEFSFLFEAIKNFVHVSTFSCVQLTRKAVTTTISNNYFECDYWNCRSIKYDLEENIFWFVKLVKGSKGTQYSAESAPALVPALVEHHQLCWVCDPQNIFSGGRPEGSKCNLKFQSATWSQAPTLHCLLYLLNINLKGFLNQKINFFLTMIMHCTSNLLGKKKF